MYCDMLIGEAVCHFSFENVVPTMHEQNVICSKTRLDGTSHEQTIICRQLFAGHMVGSRPMERKEKMHQMIANKPAERRRSAGEAAESNNSRSAFESVSVRYKI